MNCRIQTPPKYVDLLLSEAGYTREVFGKKVLENSCGEGNILSEIVKRYIDDARRKGIRDEEIKLRLHNDIKAYEIESDRICICIEKLKWIAESFGIKGVSWNIVQEDYLHSPDETFDFIIGNPPYITYHDLKWEERVFLQNNFEACKYGRFDYYYAFIEKSLQSLV